MRFTLKLKTNDVWLLLYTFFVQTFYLLQGTIIYNSYFLIALMLGVASGTVFVISKKVVINNAGKIILTTFITMVLVTFYFNRDTRLPIAVSTLLVGMFADEKKLISWLFWIRFILILFVIFMGGYYHKNTLAMHGGITLILFAMYGRENKIRYYRTLVILGYFLLVLFTKSGSMAICGGLGIALFLLQDKKNIRKILLSKIMRLIYPIFLMLNLFFAMIVNQSNMQRWGLDINVPYFLQKIARWLDVFTSSRISLAQYSLSKFGISLLGNNIDFSRLSLDKVGYFSLDSGLMWLIQQWGIIFTVIFMILTVYYIWYLQKSEQYSFLVLVVMMALWSFNEDILVSAGINIVFFFVGKSFIKETRSIKKYEYT